MELGSFVDVFKQSWEAVSGIVALALVFLFRKLNKLDDEIDELALDMTKNYVSQSNFDRAMDELKEQNKEMRIEHREIRVEQNMKLDRILDILDRKADK